MLHCVALSLWICEFGHLMSLPAKISVIVCKRAELSRRRLQQSLVERATPQRLLALHALSPIA